MDASPSACDKIHPFSRILFENSALFPSKQYELDSSV